MSDAYRAVLDEAFGPGTDFEVLRAVKEGILLADDVIRSVPLLNNAVGFDLRGHIRRAGVMFRFAEGCKLGDLPFTAEIKKMERGSFHLLEICSAQFKAHIVRTDSAYGFPEHSETRQDERLTSQQDLFAENVVPISEELAAIPTKYAWLGFGADRSGALTHAAWGMPGREKDVWLAHTDIIERFAASGAETAAPEGSVPAQPMKLRFKEHIEESLSDKPKQSDDKSE